MNNAFLDIISLQDPLSIADSARYHSMDGLRNAKGQEFDAPGFAKF